MIVSDVHNYIEGYAKVLEQDPDADYYLDLGDNFCDHKPSEQFLMRWCSVRGNNDLYPAVKVRNFTIFNKNIRMMHGEDMMWLYGSYRELFGYMILDDVDVLLLGHTHRCSYLEEDGRIIMNPGSIGRSRDYELHEKGLGSYCVLTIFEDGTMEHEFKTIERR